MRLADSHLGLILTHTSITLPFALWMLTGYFNAIPRDLDQAALIDGCSRLGVFISNYLPDCDPWRGGGRLFRVRRFLGRLFVRLNSLAAVK